MIDLTVLRAYFGEAGPYAALGRLAGRMRHSSFGRHALAFTACLALLVVLAPFALISMSLTSRQATASVFTPLFWTAAFFTWRAVARKPSDVKPAALEEDSQTTEARSGGMIEKVLPYAVGVLAFVAVRAMGFQNSTMILIGGLAGLACGLLPYLTLKQKNPTFARTSLWVSGVSGMVGGALLGLPAALLLTAIGHFRGKSSG